MARTVLVVPLFVIATSATFYAIVRAQYVRDWERHAVDTAEDLNADLVAALARPGGRLPDPATWSEAGLIPEADAVARRYLRVLNVVRINVFSKDGALVYSTQRGLAPRPPRANEKLEKALAGQSTSSVEFGRDEQDFEEGRHLADLMETYLPMRLPDGRGRRSGPVVGAFEVYQDVATMRAGLDFLGGVIVLGSLAVLGLLAGILVMVDRRATRAVRREREAQVTLARWLEETVAQRTADLRQEREILASVLDGAPVAFALLDKDLRVLYVTRQFAQIAGTVSRPLAGPAECSDHWVATRRCERCVAEKALATGRVATQIRSVPDDRGETRWIEHVAVPVRARDAAVRVVEMVTDVTERRLDEERLARAGRLATAGEIAATVAHEVRNAATTTRLLLQLWRERGGPGPEDLGSIDVALVALQRMEVLVENLLRLASPRPSFALIDCAALLTQAVDLVRADAHRRKVQLVEDAAAGDAALCHGDAGLLTEAIVNLLLNGIQACDRLPPGAPRRVSANVQVDGSSLVLRIADTGPGIPPDAAGRLFEPFFTTREGGTGLGLPIARRVVEGHGGTLVVDSQQGGAQATLVLPLAKPEVAA